LQIKWDYQKKLGTTEQNSAFYLNWFMHHVLSMLSVPTGRGGSLLPSAGKVFEKVIL
jgi:hypothetical protein